MNWWFVRLAMDGNGRLDPARFTAVRRTSFRDLVEMHFAQNALDELTELAREEAKRDTGS